MRFLRHEWRMNRKPLLIWTFVTGGMAFAFMMLFPMMENSMADVNEIFGSMGAFTDAFGMDRIDIGTPMGFFGVEIAAIVSMAGGMFGAILGISMLAKEEGGHTVEYIYTAPRRRGYFVRAKFVAMVTLLLVFDAVVLGLSIAGFYAIGEEPEWKKLLLFFLAQYLMHVQIGGMCFGLSAFLRRNNIGLGIGIAFLLYFLNLFANVAEEVKDLRYLTPYSYCDPAELFSAEAIPVEYLAAGMGIMVIFLLIGGIHYQKKDLYA